MNVVEQLTEMYESKYDDLVRIYKSRAGANDVEDLVQEAFYRALYYKDSYNAELVKLENWFVSIINNCLKDLLREKRDGAPMHNELKEDSALVVDSDSGFYKVLLKEIGGKEGDTKQILYLHFMCGHDLQEVQRALGVPYTSVRQALHRFRELIRAKYPEYKDDCI